MSNSHHDQQFRAMADSFIHLANQHSDTTSHDQVAAALAYAAARYASFVASTKSDSQAHFSAAKDEALAYFVKQFEDMLRENLDDHETHFNRYRGQ
ncbi:MAG: DUF3144 domain-containing protein [Burkholderiaceae bacterium]